MSVSVVDSLMAIFMYVCSICAGVHALVLMAQSRDVGRAELVWLAVGLAFYVAGNMWQPQPQPGV